MKHIFLISPVRGLDPETEQQIAAYVAKLEAAGNKVFWPKRDNPLEESDTVGLSICEVNREAMLVAEEVHIWYASTSQGSIFDFGMFFMMIEAAGRRKFVIANPEAVQRTSGKSFQNVILEVASDTKHR